MVDPLGKRNREKQLIFIRPERPEDHTAVHEINCLAFGEENEAKLVDDLRAAGDFIPDLSLVAVIDQQIVGHILFPPITIRGEHEVVPALALAPMAVRPEFQNQGIGSELVREGLKRCVQLGHKIVVVVGHPDYYPRFGFSPARAKGLEAPFPVRDEAFLVIELVPGALDGVGGVVCYPPAFESA